MSISRAVVHLGPLALLTIVGCSLFGIGTTSGDEFYGRDQWQQLFKDAGGWSVLPIPDSKYEPGAIIKVIPGDGMRYLGHMRDCGYPDSVIAPTMGITPSIQFTQEARFDIDARVKMGKVEAGPEAAKVEYVTMDVDSIEASALNWIRINAWEVKDSNDTLISDACRRDFNQADTYIVSESFIVEKAVYSLLDSASVRLDLTGAELGALLNLETGTGLMRTASGGFEIAKPVTVAVRQAVWTGDRFKVLGQQGEVEARTADELISQIYLRDPAER